MKTKLKFGFTLAEILITLGIIGIIAAITIPVIVNNYTKVQYVSGLKKAYTSIQTALKQYIVDQGVDNLSQTNLFNTSDPQYFVNVFIKKYFNVVEGSVCLPGDGSCVIEGTYLNNSTSSVNYEFGNGEKSNSSYYVFCTIDGICFGITLNAKTNCNPHSTGIMKGDCGSLYLDVNGAKPPNKLGRDYFWMIKIDPWGNLFPVYSEPYSIYVSGNSDSIWQNDTGLCGGSNPSANTTGHSCTARIIDKGWVMDY